MGSRGVSLTTRYARTYRALLARRVQYHGSVTPMTSRVLVADDDLDLLDSVILSLTDAGAVVVSARTGAELLERLADEGPFDLVITDVSMPWMTGLHVALSAREAGFDVPVIVMTGLADESLPERVRSLGERTTLIRKPFQAQQLKAAVALVLPSFAWTDVAAAMPA